MIKTKQIILLFVSLFYLANAKAQVGAGYLISKGFSGDGLETEFTFGHYVSRNNLMTLEALFSYYQHAAFEPLLMAGCRHNFIVSGHGWYIEPQIGYSFGSANFPKSDSVKFPSLYINGNIVQPKLNGIGAGAEAGYLFHGGFPYSLGLRYEHVFVAGDPAINILALRFSVIPGFIIPRKIWPGS